MGNCMDCNEGTYQELPLHTVYVSAFYMDSNLVSYTLWTNVYQWANSNGYSFDYAGSGKAASHPVQQVDWYDCVKWCNARSQQAGLTPVYYTDAGFQQVYTNSPHFTPICPNWAANGYRLPTEAEWEKAARGGAAGHRFPWSDTDTIDWSRANYYVSTNAGASHYAYDVNPTIGWNPAWTNAGNVYTSPVGSFAPNGYGLYDMVGNVIEWCWDVFSDYSTASETDPHGPSPNTLGVPVCRGGAWSEDARSCRCSARGSMMPSFAHFAIGFRCVRGF
jgi:formylglycine-generating enzyme required for sulfatase activity